MVMLPLFHGKANYKSNFTEKVGDVHLISLLYIVDDKDKCRAPCYLRKITNSFASFANFPNLLTEVLLSKVFVLFSA